jgi:Uma2 family endonuclease
LLARARISRDRCTARRVQIGERVAGATFSGMAESSTRIDPLDPNEARTRPLHSEPEPPRGEWWSDEPEMENYRHLMQMLALIATLHWRWRGRTDYFVGGNLSIYFSEQRRKSDTFRGPDFFVALGVDGARERRSWVVWEEGGKYPNVIIELLSDSTRRVDRGEKKQIYQDVFRTPEYFLFDPETAELEGFRLVGGRYESIEPDPAGRLRQISSSCCLVCATASCDSTIGTGSWCSSRKRRQQRSSAAPMRSAAALMRSAAALMRSAAAPMKRSPRCETSFGGTGSTDRASTL